MGFSAILPALTGGADPNLSLLLFFSFWLRVALSGGGVAPNAIRTHVGFFFVVVAAVVGVVAGVASVIAAVIVGTGEGVVVL